MVLILSTLLIGCVQPNMCADIPEVYTITKNSPEHGTVELSKTSAMVGETITVTATPAEHYQVSEIRVNDTAIRGTSFTMPASNVNVEVNFVTYLITKTPPVNGRFTLNTENAAQGETVTITDIMPDNGYSVFDIKVDKHLEITGNTATFIMPSSNVNVSITFISEDTPIELYIGNSRVTWQTIDGGYTFAFGGQYITLPESTSNTYLGLRFKVYNNNGNNILVDNTITGDGIELYKPIDFEWSNDSTPILKIFLGLVG